MKGILPMIKIGSIPSYIHCTSKTKARMLEPGQTGNGAGSP